ncbi:MAG: hypothetical protein CSA84_06045 [Actinomycetales bacterium]|nr:MAG: hypothetical protein CSA84_06045 [Actinomycetales bacterium]
MTDKDLPSPDNQTAPEAGAGWTPAPPGGDGPGRRTGAHRMDPPQRSQDGQHEAESRPHRPDRTRIYVAGAVVLALIVVGGALLFPRLAGGATDGQASATPTSAAPSASVVTASDRVHEYLDALATGDATAALAILDDPGDTTLLTDGVLAQSAVANGAISDIDVTPTTEETPTSVTAQFAIGGQPTTVDFPVVERDDGWKVGTGTGMLRVRGETQDYVPVSVNGVLVPAAARELPAFPGVYAFTSDAPHLTLAETAKATVRGPDQVDGPELLPWALKDPASIVQFAKASLDGCMKQKDLKPTNCPFGIILRPGQTVADLNTFRWVLRNDPLAAINPAVDPERPLTVSFDVNVQVRGEAKITQDGEVFDGTRDEVFKATALIDLKSVDPTIRWTYSQ